MNNKHTPGPWFVGGHRNGGKYGSLPINSDGPHHIADTYNRPDFMPINEFESNAHLIAAAPELLAALLELVTVPNKHRPDRIWEQAKQAIAKATGNDH